MEIVRTCTQCGTLEPVNELGRTCERYERHEARRLQLSDELVLSQMLALNLPDVHLALVELRRLWKHKVDGVRKAVGPGRSGKWTDALLLEHRDTAPAKQPRSDLLQQRSSAVGRLRRRLPRDGRCCLQQFIGPIVLGIRNTSSQDQVAKGARVPVAPHRALQETDHAVGGKSQEPGRSCSHVAIRVRPFHFTGPVSLDELHPRPWARRARLAVTGHGSGVEVGA